MRAIKSKNYEGTKFNFYFYIELWKLFTLIMLFFLEKKLFHTKVPLLGSVSKRQCATVSPAHHTQRVLHRTVETVASVLTVLKAAQAKCVDQTGKPTNIRVNSRSMPARKTSAFQLFHRVNV